MRSFSLEPLIGSGPLGVLNLARKPPDLTILSGIKLRDIGLDIEKRGSIENIHIFDGETPAFNTNEFHHGNPDRVWTLRCSCCE